MAHLLKKLALHRRELRAWALYDWANSAFLTIIVTAVFPIFFIKTAQASGLDKTAANLRFTITTTIALSVVAVLAPILGAVADQAPIKKRLLASFLAVGVSATAAMFFIGSGQWPLAAILFALGNIGAMGSFVFYDSLLPHIADGDEIDRVSTAGYALGYVGGGILLALNIWWITQPEFWGFADVGSATRTGFVSVAVWWLVFSIPLFRGVPEPAVAVRSERRRIIRDAFAGLRVTFRELKSYRQAMLFLLAFLIYNDGVGTIFRLATAFGTELGLDTVAMITAILITQFVGIPFSFAFGALAGKVGTKRAIFLGLTVYALISVLGYGMQTEKHFYMLAFMVGMVQGGVQALSRSLFASMIPKEKSSEFFGLFAVFEKFAGIAGPLVFGVVIYVSGSSRVAILAIISFFVVGGGLLALVDVDEGRRRIAEPSTSP